MPSDSPPLDDQYRIHLLGQSDAVTVDDVLDFWASEGAVSEEEAERRVHEVVAVATGPDGEIVGVSTAFLERSQQLRMDLWFYRTYVARAHRRSQVARYLLRASVAELKGRFVSGGDTRGAGIAIVGQNADLKRVYTDAVAGSSSQFTFVGADSRGDRVRVHFFPGATAPLLG